MSHIGNKIRAGFFATPITQGKILKELIKFNSDTSILDPTCGEGEILSFLAQGHDVELNIATYGVEIDKSRSAKAKDVLTVCLQAPIESCVISNDAFGMVYLNPPYDHTMAGIGDDKTDRKEYTELLRGTRYVKPGGVLVYVIPSYRFADTKIARHLATQFEHVAIARFTDEDYDDFRQCIFIGYKKRTQKKLFSEKLYDFLLQMANEDFVMKRVAPINMIVGKREWIVPQAPLNIPTFYTRLESKEVFIEAIKQNKGFEAFKERTKPKTFSLSGQPIINISQGQMALLLASGMVNGVIGEGDTLHALQGLEVVTTEHEQEHTETGIMHISRTKRSVSIKIIIPEGDVIKLQ